MGYYSDVALALTRDGVRKLNEKLSDASIDAETRKDAANLLASASKHLVDGDSGSEVWYWRDIKWYTSDPQYCPDVCFIDKFLCELDFEDFRFMRVGEDDDDTEAHGGFVNDPFDLTLSRSISFTDAL